MLFSTVSLKNNLRNLVAMQKRAALNANSEEKKSLSKHNAKLSAVHKALSVAKTVCLCDKVTIMRTIELASPSGRGGAVKP